MDKGIDEESLGGLRGEDVPRLPDGSRYIIVPPRPPLPATSGRECDTPDLVGSNTEPIPVIDNSDRALSKRELKQQSVELRNREKEHERQEDAREKKERNERRRRRNTLSSDGSEFFTRKHWREPFFRLVTTRFGSALGVAVFYGSLGFLFVPVILFAVQPEPVQVATVLAILAGVWLVYMLIRKATIRISSWWRARRARLQKPVQPLRPGVPTDISFVYGYLLYTVMLVLPVLLYAVAASLGNAGISVVAMVAAALLLFYLIAREWYRWRERSMLVELTELGIVITTWEPNNLFFLFNGDASGMSDVIEGSRTIEPDTSWPNWLLFWRCGDLIVTSKTTGGVMVIDSIPNRQRVLRFLKRMSISATPEML